MIPYLNMAPYRRLGPPQGCSFVPLIPRESIAALESGRVLAAAVPVGGLFRLGQLVEPIGRFGIAAEKECRSVMFFSDRPFDRFADDCTLRITSETASSLRLLFLLLGYSLGFDRLPALAKEGRPANGELLIGDKALVRAFAMGNAPEAEGAVTWTDGAVLSHVADLATLWYAVHGLPFVFARWVIRKDAPVPAKKAIEAWLAQFREQESDLVAACIPQAAQSLGLPAEAVAQYFTVIRRCLGDRDIEGQMRFMAEFEKYRKEPLFDINKGNR
jgi:predicted solute-binding protein